MRTLPIFLFACLSFSLAHAQDDQPSGPEKAYQLARQTKKRRWRMRGAAPGGAAPDPVTFSTLTISAVWIAAHRLATRVSGW